MSIVATPDLPTEIADIPSPDPTRGDPSTPEPSVTPKIRIRDLNVYYGSFRAVREISLDVAEHQLTAIIGPSGCGKSTLLRSINRMTDLIQGAGAAGEVSMDGENLLDRTMDVVDIRRRVGMVFQRPNPFPKSIFDNVAYGPRLYGIRGRELHEIVERTLHAAALWDEVKDKLKQSAMALSGGQQQRVCLARALAVEPEVILMDEPWLLSTLADRRIENSSPGSGSVHDRHRHAQLAQASRISDRTAFLTMGTDRAGYLVEMDETTTIFTNPANQLTEDYVSGRFG